jgi:hypothetical protein
VRRLFTVPGKVPLYLAGENPETASETAANVGVEIRAETPLALYPAAVTAAMTARMEGAEVFFSMARFSATGPVPRPAAAWATFRSMVRTARLLRSEA